MTTRQPLQPLSPPPAHAVKSRYAHLQRPTSASTSRSNGRDTMQQRDGDFEDLHDAASVVSGLSSLENDAEDEFDRLMIRNERDQRRLSQAAGGKPQPFSKARAHPRVGLTLENLERNNAEAGRSTNANVQLESPPSSSGSVKNDPSIHAPASWGRKSRSNRNWMRAITRDEGQQTPVPDDDAPNGHYNNVGVPHRSVEDSPLSHKTSMHGTPRPATPDEWDLTFELNEASMIASTPYIPRSTVLDDIRQREMEAANEQAKDAARAARTRGSSPDQISRRSSFTRTAENAKSAPKLAPAMHDSPPSQKKLRSRTQSWQNMSKSQPVLGVTKERMPAAMYKSTESIATVDREVIATVEKGQPKRVPHRRQDSQDLLRRLARASNTPSPARPQATPPGPLDGASETATVRTVSSRQEATPDGGESASVPSADSKPVAPVPDAGTEQKTQNEAEQVPEPLTEAEAKGGDATPVPAQRTLNPKTPVVTGAWVDTPGPRTAQRSTSTSTERDRSRSQSQPRSSRKSSMSRDKSPERPQSSREGTSANTPIEPIRPQLPRSALQALVEEAKAHRKESSTDFGDSTLNSLEELITPLTEIAMDDTLQGLQVPTDAPRNDAERQRQQELVHLHRMNDRLRAARTSIRDASRGMKRVEDQVEHVEEGENGEKIKVMTRTCICSSGDHVQNFSMWKWWKSLFWEQRLKTLRQKSNSRWRVWGGLTGLSIFLIFFLAWLVSEEIACEMYCRPLYAYSYPYPFSVNPNAPKYPYVIPTLVYRTFIRDWWVPISSFFSWMGVTLWACIFGQEHGINYAGGRSMRSAGVGESHWVSGDAKIMEERAWDASMFNDEILPGRR